MEIGKAVSAPVFEISNLGRGSQEEMAGGRHSRLGAER